MSVEIFAADASQSVAYLRNQSSAHDLQRGTAASSGSCESRSSIRPALAGLHFHRENDRMALCLSYGHVSRVRNGAVLRIHVVVHGEVHS
jgi:hypothetical protein